MVKVLVRAAEEKWGVIDVGPMPAPAPKRARKTCCSPREFQSSSSLTASVPASFSALDTAAPKTKFNEPRRWQHNDRKCTGERNIISDKLIKLKRDISFNRASHTMIPGF